MKSTGSFQVAAVGLFAMAAGSTVLLFTLPLPGLQYSLTLAAFSLLLSVIAFVLGLLALRSLLGKSIAAASLALVFMYAWILFWPTGRASFGDTSGYREEVIVFPELKLLPEAEDDPHESQEKKIFNLACAQLMAFALGTDIHQIEKEMNLPAPLKTYVGSSLYEHRRFTYLRGDGLYVEIGLMQLGEDGSYTKGKFEYLGHHTVATEHHIWKRWVYTDGLIEYKGERSGPLPD